MSKRNAVISFRGLRIENITWSPFSGNHCHLAVVSVDFDSSVFAQLVLLRIAGRNLRFV